MPDLLDAPGHESKLHVTLMAKREKNRDHDSPSFQFCGKKKKTKGCIPIPDVKLHDRKDFNYTSPNADPEKMGSNPPCGDEKARCPVQLVFIKGKPNLRFCREPRKPGYLVPVKDPEAAQRLAKRACAEWSVKYAPKTWKKRSGEMVTKDLPRWPKRFFDRKAPFIKKKSSGLGETQHFNPIPVLLGTGVAVFLISKLKR